MQSFVEDLDSPSIYPALTHQPFQRVALSLVSSGRLQVPRAIDSWESATQVQTGEGSRELRHTAATKH